MNNVFEKIIAREVPADILYEDNLVTAFLDIRPHSKGHTLVVPKKRFENIFDADEKTLGHMMSVAKKIAHALREVVDATAVNIIMNSGEDAGQEVFHAHLHVIPRHQKDGVFKRPKRTSYDDGEADMLAKKLREKLT